MQQRYYDPLAGRFLSMDPISTDADTGDKFDRYAYASNNPYRYTDPDGQDEKIIFPAQTGSNIPATVTIGSDGSTSGTGIGMSPMAVVAGAAAPSPAANSPGGPMTGPAGGAPTKGEIGTMAMV
jgi:uncharacterized protein RhaS with RHS repeats